MRDNYRNEDLTYLLLFLWKWKKVILASGFCAAIFAAIITSPYITKPKYEAVSILFATRSNSPEKLLDEQEFGYDIDADRLLQILESGNMQDSVSRRFDLASHYKIDTADRLWKDRLKKEYSSKISFERTKYMSIVINVLDTDPILAAEIANAIPAIADRMREIILKKNTKAALDVAEKEYFRKLELVEKLRAQLDGIRNKNTASMTTVLSRHYNEKSENVKNLRKTLDEYRKNYNIYDYSAQVNILNLQLTQAKSIFQHEKGKLSVYEKTLLPKDTLLINTKARLEGATNQLENIQKNLSQLSQINKEYLGLMDKLSTEQNILNQVQPEFEKMQYSFEPTVSSSLFSRLSFTYNVELNLLNDLMVKYEKARHYFNMPIAGAYLVSKAEPSYQKKFPKTKLTVAIAFIITSVMAVVSILIIEKLYSIKDQLNVNKQQTQLISDESKIHKVY